MRDVYPNLFESANAFQETCPWCGEPLSDRTAVEKDRGMLFYRVRFKCRACSYWLCTRLESFCVLGPVPQEDEPTPAYLSPADQRIRHDLTQAVVRQLMPAGVDSYEAGCVFLSDEETVIKLWSNFEVGGLHLGLARLANGYLRQGDVALARRALELALEIMRSANPADPTLSDSDPANQLNAGRILANLAIVYEQEGRREEAQALLVEARSRAPKLFESS